MPSIVSVGLVAVGSIALVAACTPFERTVIRGSGEVVTQDHALSGFDRVEAGRTLDLLVRPAEAFAVSLTADDDFLGYVTVEQRGDTLKLDVDDDVELRGTHRVEITMPSLRHLELHGAASADVAGFGADGSMEFDLSGASDLLCTDIGAEAVTLGLSGASDLSCTDLRAARLEARLSGASDLELDGSATSGRIRASGASEADLEGLALTDADVRLSGASHAAVTVGGRLEADLSGASELRYAGDPELGTMKTSGGSSADPA